MQAALVTSIEKNVERAASALLAAACGLAAYVWLTEQPTRAAAAAAAGGLVYLLSMHLLGAISPETRRPPVAVFDVREVEPMSPPELLLTDRVVEEAPVEEPLLLDDILSQLGPDSRVVRLFDPAAMPTAGELKSRIDRHLDREASAAQTDDAAQALHDALAELRRSMR